MEYILKTVGIDAERFQAFDGNDLTEEMEYILKTVGIDAERFQAFDGNDLTEEVKKDLGVKVIKGYRDRVLNRPITRGEMGGTITHHNIWTNIIQNKFEKVMVLEDDAQFFPNFKENLRSLLAHLADARLQWDFIYLGYEDLEPFAPTLAVPGVPRLVEAKYSHWLVGYLISLSGAKKLVDAEPLSKILVCDEFLPIMYDRSNLTEYKHLFPNRNLIAYSASPPLLEPRFFKGEHGYVSDSEATV
ncbi:hypothetical protein HAZT_HAZT011014 [Hyalella azteca]|uniref:Glycosyl transferase family 25 domain-containing protein n=1 Tax=Hyalella azteca TaxID=294128 RepID=A0A6A0HAY8_HYAAZ|nr:hypothetical protein HAZT_HAZT011014 [Hyalella azteca]